LRHVGDATLLDTAATTADELAALLATVNGERQEHSEIKTLRDRAYTLCKNLVDEIRACGQYALWRNPDRVKGYASEFIRKQNRHRAVPEKETKPETGEYSAIPESVNKGECLKISGHTPLTLYPGHGSSTINRFH
jgi:hypothetical protein